MATLTPCRCAFTGVMRFSFASNARQHHLVLFGMSQTTTTTPTRTRIISRNDKRSVRFLFRKEKKKSSYVTYGTSVVFCIIRPKRNLLDKYTHKQIHIEFHIQRTVLKIKKKKQEKKSDRVPFFQDHALLLRLIRRLAVILF